MTMIMEITMATMGRLIKNLDMAAISLWRLCSFAPFAQAQNSLLSKLFRPELFGCPRLLLVDLGEAPLQSSRDCRCGHQRAPAGCGFCCRLRPPPPGSCLATPKLRAEVPEVCRVSDRT